MKKKLLCSAEKKSVIWAEPHSRSSAEQFSRTEHSVSHYYGGYNESANWYLLFAMVMAYVCLIRGLRHNFKIVSLITPNFRQYSVFGLRFT